MVLLSFDIEEFDLPLEYDQGIDSEQEIAVSSQGLERILDVLEKEGVVATFYSTARYMREMPMALRQRLLAGGHEIASHGVEHSAHTPQDYDRSRQMLRALTGQSIYGFRMARMQPVDYTALVHAGYNYDSSLHPTYLPGRYNNLSKPRLPHQYLGALWRLPASVTPMIRFPLFWLSMHNLPLGLYVWMMKQTHKADGYLNVYYHPWEFADLSPWQGLLPSYILRNSGLILAERLSYLIQRLKEDGAEFGRTIDYLENIKRININ